MAVVIRRLALPAMVAALVLLAAVVGGASAARPLGGDDWAAAGGARLPGVGDSGGGATTASVFVIPALRRLYLQRLGGPGASCGTNSPNNGCPP